MNFVWDDAAEAEFRKLRADGKSFGQCATQIGCTRNAAIGRAHRLGIDRRIPQRKVMTPKSPRPLRLSKTHPNPKLEQRPMACTSLPLEPPRPFGKRIGVMEVTGCRHIFGDPHDGDYTFCNMRRVEGLSWCHDHAILCLMPAGRAGWRPRP
jgi:hypothetical protein